MGPHQSAYECFSPGATAISRIMPPELSSQLGFPGGTSGKELTSQCRRCKRRGLDPWVGKIPWRRAQPPTSSVLAWRLPWAEEPGTLQSMDHKELDMTKLLTPSLSKRSLSKPPNLWVCHFTSYVFVEVTYLWSADEGISRIVWVDLMKSQLS